MKQDVMSCSAKAPMCPCYKALAEKKGAESFAAEKPTVFAMLEYLKYNPSNGVKGIDALPPGEYKVKKGEASKSKLYYGQEMKELKEGDLIIFVAIDRLHYDTNVAFNVPIYEYENNKIEYYDYDGRPTKRGQGGTKDAYFNNALFDSKTSKLPLRDIPLDWVRISGLGDASFYGHKFMQGFRKWISNAQNKKMVNDEYNRRFGKKLNAETFEAQAPRGHKMMTAALGNKIPPLYSQDEKGDEAIVYAHYFNPYGIGEWWILEWDGKEEMFGYADLGFPELGYISLSELENISIGRLGLPLERDLHWREKTLGEVKKSKSFSAESHAYSYAYNDGHSDSRKGDDYRPNLSGSRQEADFKKILKQKAEYTRDSDGRFSSKSAISLTTAAIIGLAGAYLWRGKK